ncbi:hypothetical protein HMI56_003094 [Coelomomyces lativittatus]|nr:hypothetical protein HMI56_003094 [Coelomomyces lativittatus]
MFTKILIPLLHHLLTSVLVPCTSDFEYKLTWLITFDFTLHVHATSFVPRPWRPVAPVHVRTTTSLHRSVPTVKDTEFVHQRSLEDKDKDKEKEIEKEKEKEGRVDTMQVPRMEDTLMMDEEQGGVLEGTSSNFFILQSTPKVVTMAPLHKVLKGTLLHWVREACLEFHWPMDDHRPPLLPPTTVQKGWIPCLCSTSRGLLPIHSIHHENEGKVITFPDAQVDHPWFVQLNTWVWEARKTHAQKILDPPSPATGLTFTR